MTKLPVLDEDYWTAFWGLTYDPQIEDLSHGNQRGN
jgi:hypothetical protein